MGSLLLLSNPVGAPITILSLVGTLKYYLINNVCIERKKTSHQMDHQVDQMRLTKFGFHLNLLGFSTFLSVLGILVSIIGEIGGYVLIWPESRFSRSGDPGPLGVGCALLVLMIPYLIMWILLMITTSQQDIPGIEKIGKVYTNVSGSLEIIVLIALIIFSNLDLFNSYSYSYYHYIDFGNIICIIGSAIFLIFACLKIHGIRVENNKLLGKYLGIRCALFILYMISFSIWSVLGGYRRNWTAIVFLIVGKVYFILDIGLTVILHSISVDRENTADPENPEEKKDLLNNSEQADEFFKEPICPSPLTVQKINACC